MRVGAVVPAAGAGHRFGGQDSKLFVPVAGRPMLLHALQALQESPSIDAIVVVARPEDRVRIHALARGHRITKLSAVVPGAAARALSVAEGVMALGKDLEYVVVHDAARPCVAAGLIEQVVREAKQYGAVACGLPAAVTVKAVDDTQAVRLTLDREGLWLMQTPQAFRRDWWAEALTRIDSRRLEAMPDDVAVLEWAGYPVQLVAGHPWNIKVTTQEDLVLAEAILHARSSNGRRRGPSAPQSSLASVAT